MWSPNFLKSPKLEIRILLLVFLRSHFTLPLIMHKYLITPRVLCFHIRRADTEQTSSLYESVCVQKQPSMLHAHYCCSYADEGLCAFSFLVFARSSHIAAPNDGAAAL